MDVRTPAEFHGGHITGSVSIPLNTLDNARVAAKGRIVVCCASGMRSASGRELLTAKGFNISFGLN
ncbi:MAG: rhodanese-like domain-containing protein [Deltaproteobacteria bacterium]|nr:rhodanese-like domain-containing protein [Deltaproteobacteria bacterium]